MNWITGVKFSNGSSSAITEVEVRVSNNGQALGAPSRAARQQVVSAIERGNEYKTAFLRNGQWVAGEDVRVVTVGYERFLRTDRNQVRADNLGNLPVVS